MCVCACARVRGRACVHTPPTRDSDAPASPRRAARPALCGFGLAPITTCDLMPAPQVLGHGPACGAVVRAEYRGTAVAVRTHLAADSRPGARRRSPRRGRGLYPERLRRCWRGGGAGVWRPSKAGREARDNSKRRCISGDGCPPQGPSFALRRRGGPRRRGVALQRPALKLGAWLQCLLAVCVTQRRADCRAWPQARQGPGSLSHNASGAGGRDTTQQSACATPTCEHCQALGSGLPG